MVAALKRLLPIGLLVQIGAGKTFASYKQKNSGYDIMHSI